jgi:hypothetical protein
MKASNSLLNYHKTQAFSLSGAPLMEWKSFLFEKDITSWHDRSSANPLTYLGFPICSSITQRNMAFSNLYDKIKSACFIHSQRSVSIRGRATILNTLIYSKLWHVLRLAIFTQTQLLRLRSLGSQFLNNRIFPRLSFSTFSLSRQQGGVGLLDPVKQQNALQWRWICPLILSETNSTNKLQPSLPLLRHILKYFCSSKTFPSYRYYLLFPHARHSHWAPSTSSGNKPFLNIINNFTKAIDALPRSFDQCNVSQFTCLSLPLFSVLSSSFPNSHPLATTFNPPDQLTQDHPGIKKLLVKDVFTFVFENQTLRLRETRTEFTRFRNLSRLAAQFVRNHQFLLQPFFYNQYQPSSRMLPSAQNNIFEINLQPFCNRLVLHHLPEQSTISLRSQRSRTISIKSIKYYKSLLPTVQPPTTTLLPAQWKRFWSIPIPLPARTVWYRCIHKKLPTKQRLHQLIPTTHQSPLCTVCSLATIEDDFHFLFACPPKLAVWQNIFQTYIQRQYIEPSSISQLLSFSSSLTRDANHPLPEIGIYQIFACTLLSIWQAHWRLVFDNVSFSSTNVIASASRLLTRLDSESQTDLD